MFRSSLPAIVFSILLLRAGSLPAQSASGENDPKVQQLYGEAKAAQASGDVAAAIAKYEAILRVAPRLGPAYNNLGALYFRQREYAKAAAVLERGLKVNPGMPSASALLGISLYQMGAADQARAPLQAALQAKPEDNNIELFLTRDLIRLEDYEAAEGHLRQLTKRDPKNQELWYLLSKIHMKLSERALSQMNAIDSNSVWAHELSGEVMEGMNNYDGAVVQLKKAVEIAPRQAGVHYKLGDAYMSLSQWEDAYAQFEAELAVDPANCLAAWKMGSALSQNNGDPEKALSLIDKALGMCPSQTDARSDRGRILLKLNRNDEAVADLQAAVKHTPDDPAVHFQLAKGYRAVGRIQEAQQEMQIFSRLDEQSRAATAAQAEEVIRNKQKAQ